MEKLRTPDKWHAYLGDLDFLPLEGAVATCFLAVHVRARLLTSGAIYWCFVELMRIAKLSTLNQITLKCRFQVVSPSFTMSLVYNVFSSIPPSASCLVVNCWTLIVRNLGTAKTVPVSGEGALYPYVHISLEYVTWIPPIYKFTCIIPLCSSQSKLRRSFRRGTWERARCSSLPRYHLCCCKVCEGEFGYIFALISPLALGYDAICSAWVGSFD